MKKETIKIKGGEVEVGYTYDHSSGDRDNPEYIDIEIKDIRTEDNIVQILNLYGTTEGIYEDITERIKELHSNNTRSF